jgi:hypothetical protein
MGKEKGITMTDFEHYDRVSNLHRDSLLRTTGQVEIRVIDLAGITRFYTVEAGLSVRVLEHKGDSLYCMAAFGGKRVRRGIIDPEHWHRLEIVEQVTNWDERD